MLEPVSARDAWEILSVLGRGYEGTVYLARDRQSGERRVLKQYHRPLMGDHITGLRLYAERVGVNPYGLYPVHLTCDGDRVLGLDYAFEPLVRVDGPIFRANDQIARAQFGAFCRMLAFLSSCHRLGTTFPGRNDFMLDRAGRFHLVDYGTTLYSLDDRTRLDGGAPAVALAALLFSMYRVYPKPVSRPGYSYAAPCPYFQDPRLDGIAAAHPWVGAIVGEMRSQPASVLLDPGFYRRLAEDLPDRVRFPRLVILGGRLLQAARKLRDTVRPEKEDWHAGRQ